MLYLKVVQYARPEGIHQGFSLYEGESIHVSAEDIRVERPSGCVTIAVEPSLFFYIMNHGGDTIDKFAGDWLSGSPERVSRVMEAVSP
jgi:hypothetical protein